MTDIVVVLVLMALSVGAGLALGRYTKRAVVTTTQPPRTLREPTIIEAKIPPMVERTVPPRREGALVLLDVDNLKGVNIGDDFDLGDRLLGAVGDVLRRALPPGSGIERLESGRFLVWLALTDLKAATDAGETLRSIASSTVVDSEVGSLSRSLSAGVVMSTPGESRARSILRADAALARAKGLGGDRTEASRAQPVPSVVPARSEIAQAIAERRMEYHVQPIVDLRSNAPAGVEALLRWHRDDGAAVSPSAFIDTVNRVPEVGIDPLQNMAVAAAKPFVTGDPKLYVSFNITGAVLDTTRSPVGRWLEDILERIPSDRLVLEIVETAVIVDPARADRLLDRLRAKGVRIALDDFGTGLSNLERLRRFQVDIVKIDRTFIDGLGGTGREEAVLASLVALAQGLDINIVAEGIETEAQAKAVRDLGINWGQGYHLGRPAPADEWARILAR